MLIYIKALKSAEENYFLVLQLGVEINQSLIFRVCITLVMRILKLLYVA